MFLRVHNIQHNLVKQINRNIKIGEPMKKVMLIMKTVKIQMGAHIVSLQIRKENKDKALQLNLIKHFQVKHLKSGLKMV